MRSRRCLRCCQSGSTRSKSSQKAAPWFGSAMWRSSWVMTSSMASTGASIRRRFPRLIDKLARVQLLVLDDWGTHSLTDQQRLDLLELFEERYQRRSTIITAQLPVSGWHQMIGEPTIADAIPDRIIHNAHRIELKGDSIRRRSAKPALTPPENPEIITDDK
jgi:hypothetical protein